MSVAPNGCLILFIHLLKNGNFGFYMILQVQPTDND